MRVDKMHFGGVNGATAVQGRRALGALASPQKGKMPLGQAVNFSVSV